MVMQREHERSRLSVEGRRTDDNDRCTVVAVCETDGTWALYPHGWDKFGVKLTGAAAENLARGILADDAQ